MRTAVIATLFILSCSAFADEPRSTSQATSLLGRPLVPAEPSAATLEKLAAAEADYRADPDNADNIIWYGRRIAYAGDYRHAIKVYTAGIESHPEDARLYRHRGHRYISLREFDRAIADLEFAARLIEGRENEVEPDGLPNALGIPVSTLHGNIWYHLGLAYYLKHDWPNALRAYDRAYETGSNDDNKVSTTHWRYMILRRMGRDEDARAVLGPIHADMRIIENHSYHQLCLFYKGEMSLDEIMAANEDSPGGSAVGYGIANWLWYSGRRDEARRMLEELAANDGWSAFGVIAAEADLAALRPAG